MLYHHAACVHKAEQVCRFIYTRQRVHMQGSETGWMQHSLRSLQCQAIPTGCEHLVNGLWSLSHPCILTWIFVSRLLLCGECEILNGGAKLCRSWGLHIRFNNITKCVFGEIEHGHVLAWTTTQFRTELDIMDIKAALINIFTLTRDQMTICNMNMSSIFQLFVLISWSIILLLWCQYSQWKQLWLTHCTQHTPYMLQMTDRWRSRIAGEYSGTLSS